eukprot:358090-Chlamydomonas_euryale.AAC.2
MPHARCPLCLPPICPVLSGAHVQVCAHSTLPAQPWKRWRGTVAEVGPRSTLAPRSTPLHPGVWRRSASRSQRSFSACASCARCACSTPPHLLPAPHPCTQVTALVERHRFLRSVCLFHTASEEQVMYPEVRRLTGCSGGVGASATELCTREHEEEVSLLEGLGVLLADVRSYARRGRKVWGSVGP